MLTLAPWRCWCRFLATWLAAAGLVACGQTGAQRDADEVAAAGAGARQRQEVVFERLRLPGEVLQAASADGCAGGQSNWVVRDDFEYFCTRGTARFVGLATQDPGQSFLDADRGVIEAVEFAAGCVPDDVPADPASVLPVLEGRPGAVGSVQHSCGDIVTEVSLLRADDDVALRSSFAERPQVPSGTVLQAGRLDIDALPEQAARTGADLLLMVQVTETYFVRAR